MQAKRESWEQYSKKLCELFFDDLVFIDESGININMVRRYGRALGGERVVDSTPVNTPVNTTVIAGITPSGPIACSAWQGGTTKARLSEWVENTLLPALKPGAIVLMDNLAAHHSKEVRALLNGAHIPVFYLPPYSPDTNPIELLWSKMKEALRKLRIRDADKLPEAVKEILTQDITPENCVNWFKKDGYEAPVA